MDIGVKNQIKKCITMAENGDPDILKNSLSKLDLTDFRLLKQKRVLKVRLMFPHIVIIYMMRHR